jgi:hypothetical protein
MPPKVPSTLPEMFAEACKAMGSISDLLYTPSIDKFSYSLVNPQVVGVTNNDSATNVSSVTSGSFVIGLDLENYSAAPKDTIFAGYNSNTDDIFLIMNFGAQNNAIVTRFDTFANFDSVLVCENNNAYIKF